MIIIFTLSLVLVFTMANEMCVSELNYDAMEVGLSG